MSNSFQQMHNSQSENVLFHLKEMYYIDDKNEYNVPIIGFRLVIINLYNS